MYEYRATAIRIVDGDTVDCRIDLGWSTFVEGKVRLYGINAPEINTPAGKESKEFLASLMPIGQAFTLRSYKDKREKYGRYLGDFWSFDPKVHVSINQQMIDAGKAVIYVL